MAIRTRKDAAGGLGTRRDVGINRNSVSIHIRIPDDRKSDIVPGYSAAEKGYIFKRSGKVDANRILYDGQASEHNAPRFGTPFDKADSRPETAHPGVRDLTCLRSAVAPAELD